MSEPISKDEAPPPAAAIAHLETRRLVLLWQELGTMKWTGADDGWDRAIEAVRRRIDEECSRVLAWQKSVEASEMTTAQLLQKLQEVPAPLNRRSEPEVEPVAWRYKLPSGKLWHFTPHGPHEFSKRGLGMQPLYTTPPTRSPLTVEEIDNICRQSHGGADPQEWARNFVRAVEAAHGIKEPE